MVSERAANPGTFSLIKISGIVKSNIVLNILVRSDKHEYVAVGINAGGAAVTVCPGFGSERLVVMDDVSDVFDIETAGGKIGGHEHRPTAVVETRHSLLALALVERAMIEHRRQTFPLQEIRHAPALSR